MAASDVRTWFARRSGALFLGGFGLVFVIVGVLILVLGSASVREHARVVRGLPAVTAENLARFPAATPVLAEGRIAPETAAAFRDFVAFTRQQFRGWKDDGARRTAQWSTLETVRPALVIATGDGLVRVQAGDYEMRDEPRRWQSQESLTYSVFGESTERVTGFGIGDTVSVEATVHEVKGVRGLRASVVCGLDRSAYLASLEASVFALRTVGSIFAGVGALLAVAGLIACLKRRPA